MRRFFLITPFLFTLAFLLNTYYWIARIASPDQFFRPLLVLWGILGLLLYPAFRITRSWAWASLLLTLFVFGFYFSETFFMVIGLMTVAGAAVWLLYSRIRGFKISLYQLLVLLDGVALAIILYSLYLNVQSFTLLSWPVYWSSVEQAREYSIDGVSTPSTKPDIYYIVLDGYPRSDVLEKYYQFDNSQFTGFLRDRGFVVPDQIHSNYGMTAVSISSTLNMGYLDTFSPGLEESHFWWLMSPFIDHSRVRSILESQGYTTVSLSTWSLLDNLTADECLRPYPVMLTDFERYLLGDTPLGLFQPALRNIASIPTYSTHRKMILHFLDSLAEGPQRLGPKFFFAHVTAPHPPFVFDGMGNPIDPAGAFTMNDASDFDGSDRDYQQGYIGQVEFLNSHLEVVLDTILKQSQTPPIIIIQADHGSALMADFSSVDNTCIQERFSPFAAYYLPGMDPDEIPANLTSVNLFRIIFNHYFDTDLPLLENKNYYYNGRIFLFNLVDVTSRIDEECLAP